MATYSWSIDKLHIKDVTAGGATYSDVILRVEATLTGTSETINSVTSDATFDLDMSVAGLADSFTAYSSVSEANTVSWVEGRVDSDILTNIKAEIVSSIEFLEKVNGAAEQVDSDGAATFPWS